MRRPTIFTIGLAFIAAFTSFWPMANAFDATVAPFIAAELTLYPVAEIVAAAPDAVMPWRSMLNAETPVTTKDRTVLMIWNPL